MLTPTPTPVLETDEVTQPSAIEGVPKGLDLSRGQWEAEAQAIAEEADARDGALAGALRYAAARLIDDKVGDGASALEQLQLAVEKPISATFPVVLTALRLHAVESGSLWAALDFLDAEIEATAEVADRARLLVEKAYILEDRLFASAAARQALERALELVAGHRGSLVAAQAMAERSGDTAFLRAVLETRLDAAPGPEERTRALVRLALLREADPESRLEEALTLYGRALDEGARDDAAPVARAGLRRVAIRLGRDAEILRSLTLEAEATAPGAERACWLSLVAAVSRYRLGSGERATTTLEAALQDDAEDLALLASAAEDHLAAARWERAAELLDRQAELTTDQDYAVTLLVMAGQIREEHLGEDDAAAARFRRALQVQPAHPVALLGLERIASRTGDASLQVSLAVGAVGRSEEAAERAALAVRAAELSESALRDLDAAVDLAKRALDAVPGYPPAVQLLERLYPALDRWQDMPDIVRGEEQWRARVATAPSADAAAPVLAGSNESSAPAGPDDTAARDAAARRLERLGWLHEEKLGDAGRAMALYTEWASLGVRRADALRALLRAAERAGDALVAAEAALRLGTELEELSTDERLAWRFRAATLYEERAAADDEAIRAYQSVLALSPTFRPALSGLARAHFRRRVFTEVVTVLEKQAAADPNPAHASVLQVAAARVEAEKLGTPERALERLARVLEHDGGRLEALEYQARVLQRLGRWEDLAGTLGQVAELVADPQAKAAIWRRLAEMLEWQLRRPRDALLMIERAQVLGGARRDGDHAPARARGAELALALAQERLYDLLGRQGEAAGLQARRLADTQAEGAVAPVGAVVDAALRLADGDQAAALLARALTPRDGGEARSVRSVGAAEARAAQPFGLEAQIAILRRLGRDLEGAAALERLAEAPGHDPATRVALLRAAASTRERGGTPLQDLVALQARMAELDADSEAVGLLDRLVTRTGEIARVVMARRLLADRRGEPRVRAVRAWDLALARAQAADLRGAVTELERALELCPDFVPALRALTRLREKLGDARAAAELCVRIGRTTSAPAQAADAFRQAARLYANVVRDDEAAARCLEQVLALEPDAEVDYQVLEVILKQRRDLDRLAQIMRRRAAAGTVEQRRARLLELADLLHALRPADAAQALTVAVEIDPGSATALLRLAELQAELRRPVEAVATFRRAIQASSDANTVSGAWIRIGQLAEKEIGDFGLAVTAYRAALLSAVDNVTALAGLSRSLVRQRDYAEAAMVLRRLATADQDPVARCAHWLQLGDLLAGAGQDPEGAAEAFEEALALDPTDARAIDRLDELLMRLDEPARLAAALDRYLRVDARAADRRLRLARLWRGPLGSPQRAVDELRRLVEQMPRAVRVREELADVLEEAVRPAEAVAEHLAILELEPFRLESLRRLRQLFDRLAERGRAGRAAAALAALGQLEAADERAVREGRIRWANEPTGTLSAAEFDAHVRHPDERHPATALLATLAEVVPRLYPVNVESWGVSRDDRVGPRSDDPVRALVQTVASVLGVTEPFDIYMARAGVPQVEIDATWPPALIVPATLLSMPRQEAFMQIGRQLGRLRAGSHVAGRIAPKDLGILLAAAVRALFGDYGRGLAPEEKLNDLAAKIARAVPRRSRRAYEQAVVAFRESGGLDMERWRAGLAHTGYRAALVVSGDVLGAFDQIARGDRWLSTPTLDRAERLNAARANPDVIAMVQFALGQELAALHARLGMP